MKKAAIAMDTYKAPTFRVNLENAGFSWTEHPGFIKKTLIFKVEFNPKDSSKLHKVIKASNEVSTQRN